MHLRNLNLQHQIVQKKIIKMNGKKKINNNMKFLFLIVLALSIAVGYIYQDHLPIQEIINTFQDNFSSNSSASMQPKKVIVVGGGLAGLSATIESTRAGNSVILIDKEKRLGGNSGKASSGINGIFTQAQQKENIEDSFDKFYQDTFKSGGGRSKASLVDILVKQSASAVEFLESFGVNLGLTSQCGGHSTSRTHRAAPRPDGRVSNIGWDIVKTLISEVQNHPQVTIMTSTSVTDLITDHLAKVSGVHYEKKNEDGKIETGSIEADAVILTTGGYGADRSSSSFLAQFAPSLTNLSTTNGPWASGDGVRIAHQLGASMVDMDQVQVHPTGFVDRKNPKAGTKFLAPEALRASGGILLNHEGKRFVNELGKRNDVSNSIFQNCKPLDDGPTVSYLLLTMEGGKKFNEKILGFYKSKGFVEYFDSITDLCHTFGLPEENVKETIREYSKAKSKGIDSYGKTVFPIEFTTDEPLYGMLITPCIHYTMGGLQFNENAQVLRDDGSPIPGLFAAGEVTGGLHGENRLAGNSLLECVVFGRIAGQNALQLK
eukprot:gb/GECH01007220.1/.p1 GENE.gb/GECH01007220.1/~~gb/GECH01007220.1/.p1  ORF type:complete len:546 (+),score=151.86 gb/GECH01007220.1/:1-1638(+)